MKVLFQVIQSEHCWSPIVHLSNFWKIHVFTIPPAGHDRRIARKTTLPFYKPKNSWHQPVTFPNQETHKPQHSNASMFKFRLRKTPRESTGKQGNHLYCTSFPICWDLGSCITLCMWPLHKSFSRSYYLHWCPTCIKICTNLDDKNILLKEPNLFRSSSLDSGL